MKSRLTPLPINQESNNTSVTASYAGKRVPVKTTLDYLDAGLTLEDLLVDFPNEPRYVAPLLCNYRGRWPDLHTEIKRDLDRV